MGDSELYANKEVCAERHKALDIEIRDLKTDVKGIRTSQEEYNRTIRNIYYTLLIIAGATILTLLGVILGHAITFPIPL